MSSMSVPEEFSLQVASPLPGSPSSQPLKGSSDVLLEGQVSQARHASRPDHATMLRRVRAQ